MGFKHTEATKQIIREAAICQWAEGRGVYILNERWVKEKMANTKRGVPFSETHKAALSLAHAGLPLSAAHIQAFTDAQHKDESGTNAAKLTRKQAWNIKFNLLPSGVDPYTIALNYDMHPKSIQNIESERSWAFLKEDDYKL